MSSSSDEPHPPGDEPASNGRLDSWKEIASYLRRSVRSAKRWEKEEGLPVHRHLHGKRDSVYAYRTELDGWWTSRGAKLTDQNSSEDAASPPETETLDGNSGVEEPERQEELAPPTSRAPRRAALIGVGFALATVLVGVVAWLSRNGSASSAGSLRPLPFKARDWVLVTRFENRTGEPLFDGMVEYALEREIAESRYVNVVPQQRVMDVLQLMRKLSDTRVDATLGREICIRDGGIRALLTGRIEKPGLNYLLSLDLVDPKSGAVVSSFAEEAAGRSRIPEVMRRSSHRLREILGEAPALIRQSEEKLASVTTPSLTALQLYSKADALMAQGQPGGAEELLKQAVAEDPRFASAHIHLAWAVRNQGNPEQDWRPAAERAFELSAGTSERERLFIRGSYYQMTGQYKKAKASYEALVSLYPDHYWASGNLVATLWRLGQPAAAADYAARIADLNPRGFHANFVAASCLLSEGRETAWETYRLRAQSHLSPETIRLNPYEVAALQLLPAYGLWLRGEVNKAFETLSRYAARKESLQSNGTVWEIANFYLLLGRLRDADEWFRRVVHPEGHLAMIAFDRGDRKAMGRYLLRAPGKFPHLLLRAGLMSEAERQMTAMENLGSPRTNDFDIVRGEIALARSRREEGIALLRRGLQTESDAATKASLMGSESLAGALEKEGKLGEAVEILEHLAEAKGRACMLYSGDGTLWMKTRLQLAGLYRRMGRAGDARRLEDELRQLLAYADSDHILLRKLKRLEGAGG